MSSDFDKISEKIADMLQVTFNMLPSNDYTTDTLFAGRRVEFLIFRDKIGIEFDSMLLNREIKVLHVGNDMVVKVSNGDPDLVVNDLEKQLRYLGVKPRYVKEIQEDEEGW